MLEKYFSAPESNGACAEESVDLTSTRSPTISIATDTPGQVPFAIFEPPHISASSFSYGAVFWRTSISTYLILLVAIFAGAAALISGVERSAITPTSE